MGKIDRNTLENAFIDLQGDVLAFSLILEDLQRHCSAGWAVVGREPIPGWTVLLLNEEQALAFESSQMQERARGERVAQDDPRIMTALCILLAIGVAYLAME